MARSFELIKFFSCLGEICFSSGMKVFLQAVAKLIFGPHKLSPYGLRRLFQAHSFQFLDSKSRADQIFPSIDDHRDRSPPTALSSGSSNFLRLQEFLTFLNSRPVIFVTFSSREARSTNWIEKRERVEAVIQTSSIDREKKKRDKHLRSEDFFFVKKYSKMTFVSSEPAKIAEKFELKGKLTIRRNTQPVTISNSMFI